MNSPLKWLGLLSLLYFSAHTAEGQITTTSTWDGAANDNLWSSANNWTPAGEPTGNAEFTGSASVTLPGTSTTVGVLYINNLSSVTLNGTTSSFSSGYIEVYGTSTLTLNIPTAGLFTSTSSNATFIGNSLGSGVLNLSGSGTFSIVGNGICIGVGSVGTVNQTNGSFNESGGLNIGGDGNTVVPAQDGLGGTGVYNISGTSTLTASFIYLGSASTTGGRTPSSGVLNINGGQVVTSYLYMGQDVTLATTGTGAISNTTGLITQTAGSLIVTGTMSIGENPGSEDSYSLSGSGSFTAGEVLIGDLAGASGTFTQSGGSTLVGDVAVGEAGKGTATLSGGSYDLAASGVLVVADASGSTGTFNQRGGTFTMDPSATLVVGNNGAGTYNLSGGTLTTAGAFYVGGGTGTGIFNLSGGTLNVNNGLNIGGAGGTGVFNDDGGTLNLNSSVVIASGGTFNQNADITPSASNPIAIQSGGTYNLDSGTLTIGGDMATPGSSGITATSGSIFNFGGGTVATTSDWSDEFNGSVTGNSTIDTEENTTTLTGTLTGSGLLTITGGGSVDLTGISSNSASWGIDVQNGTVDALATTFPASGGITIGSSGVVDMATSGTNTLSGVLSGSGAFNVNFGTGTDVLELTGSANFTGATTLTGGGTLQVLNGSFGSIAGAGAKVTIGDGIGIGTVNFTGNNTYTGLTTVDSGYTLNASNFSGSVTNHGALGSNATLTDTLGSPTLTISGNLISDNTLDIRMNGRNADLIQVGGTATISGTVTLINPGGTGTFTIVSTNAPGDLTLGAISQESSNVFTHATVEADPSAPTQDLVLITNNTTTSQIPGLTLTPNQASVAGALNALLNNSSGLTQAQLTNFYRLLNEIGPTGISNAQLAANLDEIGPISLQYAPDIAFENATFMVQNVDSFANNLHHDFSGFDTSAINIIAPGFGSGLGRQMQSLLAFDPAPGGFHTNAPNGVNYYPSDSGVISDSSPVSAASSPVPAANQTVSDTPPVPLHTSSQFVTVREPSSRFSEFIGADVTLADLNQNSGASYAPSSKASYTSEGVIGGISYRMTSNLSAGILIDYNHTDAKTDSYGSKTDVNTYSPGLFATYGNKGFFVNGVFTYGLNDYSNTRAVPALGSTANSSPSGDQYTADLDGGYEFHPAYNWTLTPLGGLTYTHLDVDSFTETGASPDDLSVQAQNIDSLRSRLGASLLYTVHPGQLTLQPTLTAMWQHEFMDENPLITSSFNDFASQAFTVHSVGLGRDSALISIGLTATLDNSMALFLNCTADLNGNYNAESIVGGFKGSF